MYLARGAFGQWLPSGSGTAQYNKGIGQDNPIVQWCTRAVIQKRKSTKNVLTTIRPSEWPTETRPTYETEGPLVETKLETEDLRRPTGEQIGSRYYTKQ